jgi:hypothetical protein
MRTVAHQRTTSSTLNAAPSYLQCELTAGLRTAALHQGTDITYCAALHCMHTQVVYLVTGVTRSPGTAPPARGQRFKGLYDLKDRVMVSHLYYLNNATLLHAAL